MVVANPWARRPHYASFSESEETLRQSCKVFRITPYRLAKLLQVNPSNFLRWFNGSHRPSQRHQSHLIKLHILHSNGLGFGLVDHIDWQTNEVVYKKGVTLGDARGRDPVHKFCGGLSQKKGEGGPDPADNGDEPS
jgi:hypothetical protein